MLKIDTIIEYNHKKDDKNAKKDAIVLFKHQVNAFLNDFKEQLDYKCPLFI